MSDNISFTLLVIVLISANLFRFSRSSNLNQVQGYISRNEFYYYRRWPNATVPVELSWDLSRQQLRKIIAAFITIENVSCVKFVQAQQNDFDYISIMGKSGNCFSFIGRQGGRQILNLSPNRQCFRLGTILHELLHALGFYHMHNSIDRDKHVRIIDSNVRYGKHRNFEVKPASKYTEFNLPYDFKSIMHYSLNAHSRNGRRTIVPLEQVDFKVGQRNSLSRLDMIKLNKLYECKNFDYNQ